MKLPSALASHPRLLTTWPRPPPLCCLPCLRAFSCPISSSVPAVSIRGPVSSSVYLSPCGQPLLGSVYLSLLARYPLVTKCVTAALSFFLADVTSQGIKIAQSGGEHAFHWDIRRTARMVAAGLLLSGTTLHLWFNLMSELLPFGDVGSILKKTALGQIVYGPLFTALFFSFNAYMQGETTNEVMSRLKRDLVPSLKNGFMYWTICDFLTFRYVPVQLQALANNFFAYMWTIYLTYVASSKKMES